MGPHNRTVNRLIDLVAGYEYLVFRYMLQKTLISSQHLVKHLQKIQRARFEFTLQNLQKDRFIPKLFLCNNNLVTQC